MDILKLTEESLETLKEHEEHTKKWIEGLRSGKYTQAQHAMVDPDDCSSACCLMVSEMVNGRDWEDHLDKDSDVAGFPSDLVDGISWTERLRTECNSGPSEWNDNLELTFNDIADLLEFGEVEYDSGSLWWCTGEVRG